MMNRTKALLAIGIMLAFVRTNEAQTTAFTYQGNVTLSGQPADGNHDFEFRLFLSPGGADQIGNTLTVNAVPITAGHFSVELDFEHSFSSDRYLEIRVRQTGTPTFTTLSPRQRVTSAPTAVNSLLFGGLPSSVYARTNDPRFTDFRNPLAGSLYYVQNTTTPQAATNFNITGTGTASILAANTQINLGGVRFLSRPGTANIIAGANAGNNLTSGSGNSFFGTNAGQANTIGNSNVFVGENAGQANVNGPSNVFLGAGAGTANVSTGANVYVGANAGNVATAQQNVFVGGGSGSQSTSGGFNTFIGNLTGNTNRTGSNNTVIGTAADVANGSLSYATAIGAGSIVESSNTIKLGRALDTVVAPNRLTVGDSVFIDDGIIESQSLDAMSALIRGSLLVGDSTQPRGDMNVRPTSGNADLYLEGAGTNTGINLAASSDATPNFFISHYNGTTYTDRLIITAAGTVRIPTLGSAGGTALCRNASNDISTCSSSAKYKTNISSYRSTFNIVDRLRPVTFNWKEGNAPDLGLVAEEVAGIDPLLVTYNDKGEVEGVKYDRIGVVLINTVKEQQATIDEQRERIEVLERGLNELRLLFCKSSPDATNCNPKEKK